MFDSLGGRGRSHGRELTNYRGAWLAEHEGKNHQAGFVSGGETFIIVSLALGDFEVPGTLARARKAVTRDVPSCRFARHRQICIALSFTM